MTTRLAALALGLVLVAGSAAAETRWLACRYTDLAGAKQTIDLMFDDQRNIAAIFEHGAMVDGANTAITFQSLRSRFPNYILTYNRNDGALSVSPQGAAFAGLLKGECRRSPPPKGAPSTYLGR
jgi:hypothetical protein